MVKASFWRASLFSGFRGEIETKKRGWYLENVSEGIFKARARAPANAKLCSTSRRLWPNYNKKTKERWHSGYCILAFPASCFRYTVCSCLFTKLFFLKRATKFLAFCVLFFSLFVLIFIQAHLQARSHAYVLKTREMRRARSAEHPTVSLFAHLGIITYKLYFMFSSHICVYMSAYNLALEVAKGLWCIRTVYPLCKGWWSILIPVIFNYPWIQ